jgi:hypothetical protein
VAAPEPLESLLETIRHAQDLADADAFEPRSPTSNDGDPLAGLRQTMAAEAALQAQSAPSQWYPDNQGYPEREKIPEPPAAVAATGESAAAEATGAARPSAGAGAGQGAEALVGREVLAALRAKPLPGQARAAAVERLAAQIDDADPSVLREVLAILVTGQSD